MKEVIHLLYSTPHQTIYVQNRAPQNKRDVDTGDFLMRVMMMVKGQEHLCCEEMLMELGLFDLEEKRVEGNLVQLSEDDSYLRIIDIGR